MKWELGGTSEFCAFASTMPKTSCRRGVEAAEAFSSAEPLEAPNTRLFPVLAPLDKPCLRD